MTEKEIDYVQELAKIIHNALSVIGVVISFFIILWILDLIFDWGLY